MRPDSLRAGAPELSGQNLRYPQGHPGYPGRAAQAGGTAFPPRRRRPRPRGTGALTASTRPRLRMRRAAVLAERARREAAPTAENRNSGAGQRPKPPRQRSPGGAAARRPARSSRCVPHGPCRRATAVPRAPRGSTPRPFLNPNDPNALVNPQVRPSAGRAAQASAVPMRRRAGRRGDRRRRSAERRPYAPREAGQQADPQAYPPAQQKLSLPRTRIPTRRSSAVPRPEKRRLRPSQGAGN